MDFMVDLETLGSGPTSVVVQIGAVAFDMKSGVMIDDFSRNIIPSDEIGHGFTVDGDTIIWWMQQAAKGRCTWDNSNIKSLDAWGQLARFIDNLKVKNSRVWSHSTFDAPIIAHHWNYHQIRMPVRYNQWLDLRTVSMLAKGLLSIPKTVRPDGRHDALIDARYQTEWLVKCWKELKHV